jgi:hypothetical protein
MMMMMSPADPVRKLPFEDCPRATGSDQKPVRGGSIAHKLSSFTPPSRGISRHLQGQSGAKQQSSQVGRGQRSSPTHIRESPQPKKASLPKAKRPSKKSQQPKRETSPDWQSHGQDVASELEKENSGLRALAEQLRLELRAAEERGNWYQSAAEQLLSLDTLDTATCVEAEPFRCGRDTAYKDLCWATDTEREFELAAEREHHAQVIVAEGAMSGDSSGGLHDFINKSSQRRLGVSNDRRTSSFDLGQPGEEACWHLQPQKLWA